MRLPTYARWLVIVALSLALLLDGPLWWSSHPWPRVASAGERHPREYSSAIPGQMLDAMHPASHLPIGFGDVRSFHQGLVATGRGFLQLRYRDLAIHGPGPGLEFRRAYSSHTNRASALGRGWGWNYDARLEFDADHGVYYVREMDNLRTHFRPAGDEFVSESGGLETLRFEGTLAVRELLDGSRQEFDEQGRLTALVDPRGRRTELRYDEQGLREAVDAAGRRLQFAHANGRLSLVIDPIGRQWKFEYEGDLLIAAVDPLNRRTEYQYDESGRMAGICFPNGGELRVEYDWEEGRVQRLQGPGPLITSFGYEINPHAKRMRQWSTDNAGGNSELLLEGPQSGGESAGGGDEGRLAMRGPLGETAELRARDGAPEMIDPRGKRTTMRRDSSGRIAEVVDPLGSKAAFLWDDDSGQLRQVSLPGGGQVSLEYKDGEVATVTDPSGDTTRIERLPPLPESFGGRQRVVQAARGETILHRDEYDNVIRIERGGISQAFTYDLVGRMTGASVGDAAPWTFEYDAADNLVKLRDPAGAETKLAYDALDNLAEVTDAAGGKHAYTYDERGLLVAAALADGRKVNYEFDVAGNLTTGTYQAGEYTAVEKIAYDVAGRPTELTDVRGNAYRLTYDAAGSVIGWEGPRDAKATLRRDAAGRIVEQSNADGQSVQIAYTPAGQLADIAWLKDGQSVQRQQYQYDAAGRRTARSEREHGGDRQFAYDEAGRLLEVKDGSGSDKFEYDAAGRLAKISRGDDSLSVGYEYDAAGRVARVVEAGGPPRELFYDAAGRAASLKVEGIGEFQFQRNAVGQTTGITLLGGVRAEYRYDDAGRLAGISYLNPVGQPVEEFKYTRDARGRVVAAAERGRDLTYSHDEQDRLLAVEVDGKPVEQFGFDEAGNLNRIGELGPQDLAHDAAGSLVRVKDAAWEYDARGNLISRGDGAKLHYDADGRLTKIDFADGQTAAYKYDGLGRRVEKQVRGQTTRYAYDGDNLIAEYDGAGNLQARYFYGPGNVPLAMSRDGQLYSFVTDRQGSVRGLLDAQGNPVESYDYTAYGAPLTSEEPGTTGSPLPAGTGQSELHPFAFGGQPYDADTGTYIGGPLVYDPIAGHGVQSGPFVGPPTTGATTGLGSRNPVNAGSSWDNRWEEKLGGFSDWIEPVASWEDPLGFGVEHGVPDYSKTYGATRDTAKLWKDMAKKFGDRAWNAWWATQDHPASTPRDVRRSAMDTAERAWSTFRWVEGRANIASDLATRARQAGFARGAAGFVGFIDFGWSVAQAGYGIGSGQWDWEYFGGLFTNIVWGGAGWLFGRFLGLTAPWAFFLAFVGYLAFQAGYAIGFAYGDYFWDFWDWLNADPTYVQSARESPDWRAMRPARGDVAAPREPGGSLAVHNLKAPMRAEARQSESQGAPVAGDDARTIASSTVASDIKPAWLAGDAPQGAELIGDWEWHDEPVLAAKRSHSGATLEGPSLHYFTQAEAPLVFDRYDNLVQYVYLNPDQPPKEILIQLYTEGEQGEHRVYWGENKIDLGGTAGTASLYHAGPLPKAGQWVRLRVPIEQFGLHEATITGMLFGQYDGRAFWGPTTRSVGHADRGDAANAEKTPAIAYDYTVDCRVSFDLTAAAQTKVQIESAGGEALATLWDGPLDATYHEFRWDGIANGELVSDGEYQVVVEARLAVDAEPVSADAALKLSTLIADITVPGEGAIVQGTVPLFGVAAGRDFNRYTLDYGPGSQPAEWTDLATIYEPQVEYAPPSGLNHSRTIHGNLASLYASSLAHGPYTFRLRAWNKAGHVAEDRVQLFVGAVASSAAPTVVASADGRAVLHVPPMALRRGFRLFNVSPIEAYALESLTETAIAQGATILGSTYEVRPAGFQFQRPARIELATPPEAAEESQQGIYVYHPDSGAWERLSGSEFIPAAGESPPRLAADLHALPPGRVMLAVLTDTAATPPSVSETRIDGHSLSLSIAAESGAVVTLVPEAAVEPSAEKQEAMADRAGIARFANIQLADGDNTFRVSARDSAGNTAEADQPLVASPKAFSVESPVAASELSLEQEGDELMVRATGPAVAADERPTIPRRLEAHVRSETDPRGRWVILIETSPGGGEFLGRVRPVSDASVSSAALFVGRVGEKIEAVVADGPQASIEFADKSPPVAPVITSSTHAAVFLPPMSPPHARAASGARAWSNQFVDLRQHGVLSFRYRASPQATCQLLIQAGNDWYGFGLTGEPFSAGALWNDGAVYVAGQFDLVADGEWHQAELNLYERLRGMHKGEGALTADAVLLGHWKTTGWNEFTAVPSSGCEFADAAFRAAGGGPKIQLTWGDPSSLSPIADYSFALDDSPATDPGTTGQGKRNEVELTAPAGQQTLYFHLRACDEAGNWGETAHFALTADRQPPAASSPLPELDQPAGMLETSLVVSDGEGGSGVDPDSLRLKVNGEEFSLASPALTYDVTEQRLTFRPWRAEPPLPAWSDGQRIRVELSAAADLSGNQIEQPFAWQFDVDYESLGAGEVKMVTQAGGQEPAWSADGKSAVYVVEAEERTLWRLDLDAAEPARIPVDIDGVATPAWSPKSDKIAVSGIGPGGDRDIFAFDVSGGGLQNLTAGGGDDRDPCWTPDGESLIFVRDGDLWQMAADGSAPRLLLDDADGATARLPQVSSDGKSVLYGRTLYDDAVWLLDLATLRARSATVGGHETEPAWGAGGDELLFTQSNGGATLLAQSAQGGEARNLMNRGDWQDRYARVSPSGAAIIFQSTRNGFWNLWRLDLQKLGEVSVTPAQLAYADPSAGGAASELKIAFDAQGFSAAEVRVLDASLNNVWTKPLAQEQLRGPATLSWDGLASDGQRLADGRYLVQIVATSAGGGKPLERGAALEVGQPAIAAAGGQPSDAAPPIEPPKSLAWWWLAILGLALLIIVIAAVVIRQRKRAKG